jgi:transcriptional regulator with XRE-family HTH domain
MYMATFSQSQISDVGVRWSKPLAATLCPPSFKLLRRARGVSQGWIASRCGCSVSTISKWEKGQIQLTSQSLNLLKSLKVELMQISDAGLRKCPCCRKVKHLSEFGIDRSRRSRTQSKCKTCNRVLAASWRKENAAHVAQKRRIRRKIDSAERRLARHWGKTSDDRVFQEALMILDGEEFQLQKRPGGCGPSIKELVQLECESSDDVEVRGKLIVDANLLLGESSADEDSELVLARGEWYEVVAEKYKDALLRGECTEHQVARLVRLECR